MKKLISFCVAAALGITCLSAQAVWQCNYRNARNQLWVGTGPTIFIAKQNGYQFCASHSINAQGNCRLVRCFWR